jgi:hypothetical protein
VNVAVAYVVASGEELRQKKSSLADSSRYPSFSDALGRQQPMDLPVDTTEVTVWYVVNDRESECRGRLCSG